jgi:hypothetical protein
MSQTDPRKYHVHVYREMRLYFSGIAAASAPTDAPYLVNYQAARRAHQ